MMNMLCSICRQAMLSKSQENAIEIVCVCVHILASFLLLRCVVCVSMPSWAFSKLHKQPHDEQGLLFPQYSLSNS